jgi:uncharacterized damage-inducible protein DinB
MRAIVPPRSIEIGRLVPFNGRKSNISFPGAGLMSQPLHDHVLNSYDWTQTALKNVFDAIPAEQFLYQPFPGANHALWTMGHLATVDQYFLKSIAGRDGALFEENKATFFAKSQPSPNASDYPPLEAVREYFSASRTQFRAWIDSLDDAKLASPLPEKFKQFANSFAGMVFRLCWHEGMHYGQLAVIRKSLGLAPTRI